MQLEVMGVKNVNSEDLLDFVLTNNALYFRNGSSHALMYSKYPLATYYFCYLVLSVTIVIKGPLPPIGAREVPPPVL